MDIRAHLREIYGVEVSPDLISQVTGAVIDELAEWQSRPPDAVLPLVHTLAAGMTRGPMRDSGNPALGGWC